MDDTICAQVTSSSSFSHGEICLPFVNFMMTVPINASRTVSMQYGLLPLDLRLASQAADEKRKRNAEASAHFHERRRKKNIIVKSTIQRLEQEVCMATNKAEILRRQRDKMVHEIDKIPVRDRFLQRPQSPRQRWELLNL